MNCKSHYLTASCVPAQETPPQLRCRRVSQTFHCPATPEFQKAVSDTIASVKGYKPVTELGDQPDPSYLIIRGLSPDIDELYLYYVFAPFGAIQSVQLVKDDTSGSCTGTAYVKFGMAEDALLAIQTICGNPLPDGSTIGVFVKPGAGHHAHLRTSTASIRCRMSVAFQRAVHASQSDPAGFDETCAQGLQDEAPSDTTQY
ncbi:elav [Symbiodinium sp. CCMP2592]|nr:elav [Symbiodinium sp. CCMP2592]